MWRPGTVFPDKDDKWMIDIIDPKGTPLTLRGFETCGKAKAEARAKVKELNAELRDVIKQRVIDQRRKFVVDEEAESEDPNESADAVQAENSLQRTLEVLEDEEEEEDVPWEKLTPFQKHCAEGIMQGDINGRLSKPPN